MIGSIITTLVLTAFALLFLAGQELSAQALTQDDPDLKNIDVIEHLGDTIPLNLTFTNHKGERVKLEDYFHKGKPVILTLAYYRCPMLCTMVLNGLSESILNIDGWVPGDQFEILTVSIDPTETAELADSKRHRYLENLKDIGGESEWEFMVGDEPEIKQLAAAVGFKYFYVEESKEFAHPAVVFLLTEEGVISRYLYGLEYSPRDVKLGLLEAGRGKIGNTVDKIVLYCFHYDPDAKGYVVFATNVMKLGGLVTLVLVGIFLIFLFARYRVRRVIHHPGA